MKRKYPTTYFILGIIQNMIRYFIIGLIGLIILVIGFISIPFCKIIGAIILIAYALICIIEQLFIRSAILKESKNEGFNKFMDNAFGVENDDKTLSTHERIIKIIKENIKIQDNDINN